ncbi:ABC transporter permease [Dyadobacter jiangsuensis]|uniref:ABC-2 type transport system permease protein n=1 Tax=Dyadobacter jiangsuensis TaxID=1591085 RepID=A0A2P8FIM0_9BACT|nr:ABC transporter permease [Dyadobacter jiangsuensis]PSL21560.1 ABC-2 type transport system permease protein [Dyadobacter jiangsuensis]
MRTLRFLLRKEFRQIFRDKSIVAMIFFMPMVQLILMPLAADYEVRNINLSVVDHDKSPYSQKLIAKIVASGYFRLTGYNASFKEAFGLIESDKADLILEIPHDFERNLIREDHEKLFVAVNAINGTKASLGGSYLGSIIGDFNADIRMQLVTPPRFSQFPVIEVVASNWFNPVLNYKVFIVPGILAILVTMVGGFLSALNIVREKEIGTIEQINVTPIKKHIFILGKLIPFWVLANIVFTIGLLVARFVYGIVPVGSLLTLYAFISVYLLAVLGFGLMVSTFCDTQQQAMFIMFFFMMLFILLGGLFTSIDSMPEWAKLITRVNPVRYMIEVMRMVILKGSSFIDVLPHVGVVACMAAVLNGWAVLNYKKTN